MRDLILTLVVFFTLVLCAPVFADEFGVTYDCVFPFTVVLDGDFADWPANVSWHKVTHTMGWGTLPDDDKDGSYEFACAADSESLYVAIKISDDMKVIDEDTGHSVYNDDAIELYIDGDNSKAGNYDGNDSQIMIGRENVGGDPSNPKLGGANPSWGAHVANAISGPDSGTRAAVVDTNYGWAMELAVPLARFGIKPADGVIIGFNVQLNDDDDKSGRDHKLSWSARERSGDESSYKDTSAFGDLKFVSVSSAVSSEGKAAITWGKIRKSASID
jgi:oligosaccharide reducing-end xylanase